VGNASGAHNFITAIEASVAHDFHATRVLVRLSLARGRARRALPPLNPQVEDFSSWARKF